MHTTKNFAAADAAVLWLFNNSGLWAGLSRDDQDGIYDALYEEGRACVRTPLGDVFVAVINNSGDDE